MHHAKEVKMARFFSKLAPLFRFFAFPRRKTRREKSRPLVWKTAVALLLLASATFAGLRGRPSEFPDGETARNKTFFGTPKPIFLLRLMDKHTRKTGPKSDSGRLAPSLERAFLRGHPVSI